MEKPHTVKLLEVLNEHPEGLTLDELRIKLNRKHNKDVQNTIQLLKRNNHQIIRDDDTYILNDAIKRKGSNPTNKTKDVLDILLKTPDGMSAIEIAKKCKSKISTIASRIYFLRSKGNNIEMVDGKYVFKGKIDLSPSTVKNTPVNSNHTIPIVSKLMSAKHREAFINLSEADKADCIDMLKKSLYYYKSATALIESNCEVMSFLSSVGGAL